MRAGRLVSIVLLLQNHGRMTAREMAERLEVSERTILRDMETLSGSGIPVVAERGAGGGWSLLDGYETNLSALSPAEILGLFAVRPSAVRRHVYIDPTGCAESLPVLLDALWTGRRVRFVYSGLFREPGERTVDPLGLVAKGSVWYLVAAAEGEPRTYRVSRISAVVVRNEPNSAPDGFVLPEYWAASQQQFRAQLPQFHATFLAERSALPQIRYRGWRLESEEAESGRVRVRLRFDAEWEAVQFGLSFGPAVEPVDPPDLRSKIIAAANAVAQALACDA